MAEKNIDSEINAIANQIRILHEEAYREYLGPVEILCVNPDASESEKHKDFENWRLENGIWPKSIFGQIDRKTAKLPTSMEEIGFSDVATGYAVIDLTPDAGKYSSQLAELMIESKRQNDLEAIKSTHLGYFEKVIDAVNAKYDERLHLYHEGVKQWDTSVSLTMIIRGSVQH